MDRRAFLNRVTRAGLALGVLPFAGDILATQGNGQAGPAGAATPPPTGLASFPEYEAYDALGLADLVRRGEVTALELLEAAAQRMEQRNPELNAVVFEWVERARQMARDAPTGAPFAGVPFLLKNLGTALADTPLTSGSRLFAGNRAEATSGTVRRLMEAGLVPFGRGNAPEFGITATTEPLAHGPTRNPWDLSRTAGGSSGGAGAAVAAGIVPMAYGSDAGGSARIPASCCGLVGMKPTRGRSPVSLGAALGQSLVLTRSVRDLAAALDVFSVTDPGAPFRPPAHPDAFRAEADRRPRQLRIAFSRRSPYAGRPLDPACIEAVEDAARLLQDLGHTVEEADPEYDFDALAHAMFKVFMATGAAGTVNSRERALGREARQGELEPYTWAMVERGRGLSALDYSQALATVDGFTRRFVRIFRSYDIHLTPTLGRPPLPLGELTGTIADEDDYLDILNGFMPFTMQYNAAGRPAVTLPTHWSQEGLPIGVQLGAELGEDALLIRLAAQVEEAQPWFQRRPPVG